MTRVCVRVGSNLRRAYGPFRTQILHYPPRDGAYSATRASISFVLAVPDNCRAPYLTPEPSMEETSITGEGQGNVRSPRTGLPRILG